MSRHCTRVRDGCQNELSNLFGVPFGSAYTAAHRSAEIPELMQRGGGMTQAKKEVHKMVLAFICCVRVGQSNTREFTNGDEM
ncbi:hypothetical protein QQF64_017794 [Cirrhinus molitorella]|uniref:Uncharacterized protein n=1 Tax=Cirrhinus molitorella TaxID=172907 RepID=A0ABR3LJN0_9TELE